jgi:hypothetical protein
MEIIFAQAPPQRGAGQALISSYNSYLAQTAIPYWRKTASMQFGELYTDPDKLSFALVII